MFPYSHVLSGLSSQLFNHVFVNLLPNMFYVNLLKPTDYVMHQQFNIQ